MNATANTRAVPEGGFDYVEEAERLVVGSVLPAVPRHPLRLPDRYREEGLPLDPVSVAAALDRDGADLAAYGRLTVLSHETGCFTPAARWATIVVEAARLRSGP